MAKKWIKGATENAHGQFKAKAEAAGKSTSEFAREHAHAEGRLGKQARLALVLMGKSVPGGGKKPHKSREEKRYGNG
jgi:hypothetical protein